jgi:hypothetical protein
VLTAAWCSGVNEREVMAFDQEGIGEAKLDRVDARHDVSE